ncbi:hypothetical protein [Nonomuraea dietziae]|uniref:Uncharacterized protein n=1 Tax=Nonomuraea dietziae TaxID=65515 RepID=A0A7W5YQD2_9ACTN|nr:hypothetical protein [Nonomuraea dietziae]MBB3726219.1 hypothetical protein [Nonomuraea dietziae]
MRYVDPVHEGPADPTVVWNPWARAWWMFYTSRRANVLGLPGVSWVHGTPVGIATSADGFAWDHLGHAVIDVPEPTLWAPEVVVHEGLGHMFLTVVPGVFTDWEADRSIVHLVSDDLRHWREPRRLELSSSRVIDACVHQLEDGTWRLWYNDEPSGKRTFFADSPDLRSWTDRGQAVGEQPGEGPNVFRWRGSYWMVVDVWDGLAVYRSDDALTWARQPGTILRDDPRAHHADVLVRDGRALLYYFTPTGERTSAVGVAELDLRDGRLTTS